METQHPEAMNCALCNNTKRVWDKVYHNQLEEIDCPLCAHNDTGSKLSTHSPPLSLVTITDAPADASRRASAPGHNEIINPQNQ